MGTRETREGVVKGVEGDEGLGLAVAVERRHERRGGGIRVRRKYSANYGKFMNRKKLPKQVKHVTGPWSIDSRQLCLDTFVEYCNLSSSERYQKIYEILGGERTMSKFCLAIFYEYYLQI